MQHYFFHQNDGHHDGNRMEPNIINGRRRVSVCKRIGGSVSIMELPDGVDSA